MIPIAVFTKDIVFYRGFDGEESANYDYEVRVNVKNKSIIVKPLSRAKEAEDIPVIERLDKSLFPDSPLPLISGRCRFHFDETFIRADILKDSLKKVINNTEKYNKILGGKDRPEMVRRAKELQSTFKDLS